MLGFDLRKKNFTWACIRKKIRLYVFRKSALLILKIVRKLNMHRQDSTLNPKEQEPELIMNNKTTRIKILWKENRTQKLFSIQVTIKIRKFILIKNDQLELHIGFSLFSMVIFGSF